MRIDKYLKTSRLIKRREVAKEACEGGRITVNDKPAKPGTEVKVGDVIGMRLGSRLVTVEVLALTEHVTKETALLMYKQLGSERIDTPSTEDEDDDERS